MTNENGSPVFDRQAALERVDQDTELFAELVNLFFEDYLDSIEAIKSAISENDPQALMECAHSIKSALGNLGAMRAFDDAYELEKIGRDGGTDNASPYLEQLKQNVEAFKTESSDLT